LLGKKFEWLDVLIWCAFFVILPYIVLKNWAALSGVLLSRPAVIAAVALPLLTILSIAALGRGTAARLYGTVKGFAATLLGFSSLLGVVLLIQLIWFSWQARDLNASQPLHRRGAEAAHRDLHARVIWIVLDELSFQQVYERRFPGLDLPAFDGLAAVSTVFTHTVPAGVSTELVLPSLMTGFAVDRLQITAGGQLRGLHDPDAGLWRVFDPFQTVFQDALNLGYSTAVAGWFNPYCRMLQTVLDGCFWASRIPSPGHMFADGAVTANLVGPVRGLAATTWHQFRGESIVWAIVRDEAPMHIADYRDLASAADTFLGNSSYTFLLLHLAIPHPWGIYDRRNRVFTTQGSSYIDNLALADEYLAHVRLLLETRHEWDTSAIIVMGDHSWRTKLVWERMPGWTAEDQAASRGGQYDERPVYLVKLPNQQEAARIDRPFHAVRTRALLDAILSGQLRTPRQLDSWTQQ
jgi:hypothetical protein